MEENHLPGRGQISRKGGSCKPLAGNFHSNLELNTPSFKEDLSRKPKIPTSVHTLQCSDPLDSHIVYLPCIASPRFRSLTNLRKSSKCSLVYQPTVLTTMVDSKAYSLSPSSTTHCRFPPPQPASALGSCFAWWALIPKCLSP